MTNNLRIKDSFGRSKIARRPVEKTSLVVVFYDFIFYFCLIFIFVYFLFRRGSFCEQQPDAEGLQREPPIWHHLQRQEGLQRFGVRWYEMLFSVGGHFEKRRLVKRHFNDDALLKVYFVQVRFVKV